MLNWLSTDRSEPRVIVPPLVTETVEPTLPEFAVVSVELLYT